MLTNAEARDLQVTLSNPEKLDQPAFFQDSPLWLKDSKLPFLKGKATAMKYAYAKVGKTFGFEVTRYLALVQNYLLYFDSESDTDFKGYCCLENNYLQWFALEDERFLLLLSNGSERKLFYFATDIFWLRHHRQLARHVVQLNFDQNYLLLTEIGQGSFSKVYLVARKNGATKFAAKFVRKLDKNKVSTKNLVVDEKTILSRLDCEYVYRFEEFYENATHYIFILEYLEGKDLMTLFKQKVEFDIEDVLQMFRNILRGIAECHAQNIIHRDLKPQNIILTMPQMLPKLIDFGLSLHITDKLDKRNYKRCGTMGYMAPEIIFNSGEQRKAYGPKCDLFSFGIIAHMILLGYNPLKGKSYEETFLKNKECSIELEKEKIVESYGDSCYVFLSKLLEKSVAGRYSAEEALNSAFLQQKESKQGQHMKQRGKLSDLVS